MSPVRAQNIDTKARDFSNEFRVMLASCQVEDAPAWSEPKLFEGPLDWERVLALADFHGVTPHLHQAINIRHQWNVRAEIGSELEARFKANAWKSLRLTAELFRVLDSLQSTGIEAVPYKGPALAELLYGDIAMREYSDLDVLVRGEDVMRTKEALRHIGFTPSIQLPAAQEHAYVTTGYEYTFDGPGTKNMLEIQWNFVPRFFSVDFEMDRILSRCRDITVSGRTCAGLREEDLLLALCVHGAKHLWQRVCWVRDIAGLIQKPKIDWPYVGREAQRMGISRIVGISAQLAHELLGARATGILQEAGLDDPAGKVLGDEILSEGLEEEDQDTESLGYFRCMIRMRERISDRVRFLRRLAFTPSIGEWRVANLPEPLFPLYRAIRVGRLTGRLLGLR